MRRQAVIGMWCTGALALVGLLGSMALVASGRLGYGLIWLALGLANTAMYAVNLYIYRTRT